VAADRTLKLSFMLTEWTFVVVVVVVLQKGKEKEK